MEMSWVGSEKLQKPVWLKMYKPKENKVIQVRGGRTMVIQSKNVKPLKTTEGFKMGRTGSGDNDPLFSTCVRGKE